MSASVEPIDIYTEPDADVDTLRNVVAALRSTR